jgi:hypothetical protein
MRLDVEHGRLQARGFGEALPVLHAVLARRGDQHLDVAHRGRARADDAEVEADLVEREWDVLVGLGLDLDLELFLAQACRQHDLLGDHRRLRHRHHDLARLGSALGDQPLDRFGDLVELLDLAVGDPALLETFGAESLEHIFAASGLPELDELHAGRADVEADHRRVLAPQQRVEKAHGTPFPTSQMSALEC